MQLNLINYKHFDPQLIQFGTPKLNSYGGKSINLIYETHKFWDLILPKMVMPFRIAPSDKGTWSLQLNFDTSTAEFQKVCEDLDQLLLKTAQMNSAEWLGSSKSKPYSPEIVATKYSPLIKWSKDKVSKEINTNYPPRLRVSLIVDKNEQFTTEFYDPDGNLLEVNPVTINQIIKTHSRCACLVAPFIWSSATGFGMSLKARQVKVYPPQHMGCLLNEEGDEPPSTHLEEEGNN